jgi:hypothetical protein
MLSRRTARLAAHHSSLDKPHLSTPLALVPEGDFYPQKICRRARHIGAPLEDGPQCAGRRAIETCARRKGAANLASRLPRAPSTTNIKAAALTTVMSTTGARQGDELLLVEEQEREQKLARQEPSD